MISQAAVRICAAALLFVAQMCDALAGCLESCFERFGSCCIAKTFPLGCYMRRTALVFLGFCFLVGCNTSKVAKGTLSGTVTYKGQPVNGGSLLLYTPAGAEAAAPIPLGQDGTFKAADVAAGDYKVVIQPSEGYKGPPTQGMSPEMMAKMKANPDFNQPATIKIPDKYKKIETSDLTLTVNKGGETKVNLELKD